MKRSALARVGDINAFFGLMLDNTANLVLMVSLLAGAFEFPASFAFQYMIPGTAVGVLVGDLLFTLMAWRLARRTGRDDVTAMPLGIDTPSLFGMVFFVIGPAFMAAKNAGLDPMDAARQAWHIGICAIVASGLFKLALAPVSGWVRRSIPRAGMLGSLAAIALVLISFLPLLEILQHPVVGLTSLAVILTTLVARIPFPGKLPGALAALLVGGALYFALQLTGWFPVEPHTIIPSEALMPKGWTKAWTGEWLSAVGATLPYLPIVIPFALATVVGGIDCTESAAAAGDEYPTGQVIAVEAVATLLAGLCGGVIQTTPYIGHPAYKAMGGRSGYTLATALFIGGAGLLGYFGYLYVWIPKPAILPILVFIGVEITSQSFHATPVRHYTAVALACVPALAYLVWLHTDQVLTAFGSDISRLEDMPGQELLARNLQTLRILSGGFIITSLLWSSLLAALIDRRLMTAALYAGVAAAASAVGIIHSPLQGSPLALPWSLPSTLPDSVAGQTPLLIAAGYACVAVMLVIWRKLAPPGALEAPAEHDAG